MTVIATRQVEGLAVELDDDVARIDLDVVHRWLSEDAYWALGRSRSAVVRSFAASRSYAAHAVVDGGKTELVAIARLVTDDATFAWLADVYVDRRWRGKGVGSWLVGVALERAAATGVDRMLLATRDAHEVYARHGFTALPHPERLMEIDRRRL